MPRPHATRRALADAVIDRRCIWLRFGRIVGNGSSTGQHRGLDVALSRPVMENDRLLSSICRYSCVVGAQHSLGVLGHAKVAGLGAAKRRQLAAVATRVRKEI